MWVEQHNGSWRIRDRRAGKVVTVRSGYDTKTAAKAARDAYITDKRRGEFIDPRAGRVWLKDWVAEWWDSHKNTLKISARRPEESRVRNHILERLGQLRLDEYDNAADNWWVSEMQADGLSPKSIRNCHGLLFQCMEAAILQRKIAVNPCKGTKMPETIPHEMAFLSAGEADQLVMAHPERWRAVPLVLLGTGLRWAELTGLRVGRVDVLGGTLRVEETLQEITGKGLVSVPPKTKWSRRTITLPLAVREALVPLVANRKRNEFVFTNEKGGEIRHQDFTRRIWAPSRAAVGMEHVRIHDLRHTHASWLIADLVPLTAIQRRLGHSSVAITSDIYGHLLPEVDEKLLAALQRRLSIGGEQQGSSAPGEPRKSPENIGDSSSSSAVPNPRT